MKLVNFASLDPTHQSRLVKGLANTSRLDRHIFGEFVANWESLAYESEAALQRMRAQVAVTTNPVLPQRDAPTEILRLIRTRTVQHFFRRAVLASYENQCAACAIRIRPLLNASHIIPWAASVERRADPTNGIAFCVLHDRAFDRGLISADEDFRLIVSPQLRRDSDSTVHHEAFVAAHGRNLIRPHRFQPDAVAIQFHRDHIFQGATHE